MKVKVERRKSKRVKCRTETVIRKNMPDGRLVVMEFIAENLSAGGFFIVAEDLSLFDLGEEVTAILRRQDKPVYEGRARIVRSMRIFSVENSLTQSGFGLMFLDKVDETSDRVEEFLKEQQRLVI